MVKITKKKKGFTLVELLAVIVVLAIILAIAIPSVLGVINNSKIGSMKSSARMLISAAKTELASNNELQPTTSWKLLLAADIEIDLTGKSPYGHQWNVTNSGVCYGLTAGDKMKYAVILVSGLASPFNTIASLDSGIDDAQIGSSAITLNQAYCTTAGGAL